MSMGSMMFAAIVLSAIVTVILRIMPFMLVRSIRLPDVVL
ncbi:hypothetical protein SAMN05421663_10534 [Terribacillus halophilus]|uniref:Branched-chain amino acid transport protein (AzlD) n=1 Tax=Terribacillus halophilus TaxID=361279 RepID=A0A1G6QEE9_9BACI|nr:hypothetical protein SAMN05421663_10534 [Terribacillus halophilus]